MSKRTRGRAPDTGMLNSTIQHPGLTKTFEPDHRRLARGHWHVCGRCVDVGLIDPPKHPCYKFPCSRRVERCDRHSKEHRVQTRDSLDARRRLIARAARRPRPTDDS